MRVTGRVGLQGTIFAEAFSFLRDNASAKQTPKLTVSSPSMVHYRGGNSSIGESVYPELDEFWGDLTRASAHQLAGAYKLTIDEEGAKLELIVGVAEEVWGR